MAKWYPEHKNEHTGMAKCYPEHKNEHTGMAKCYPEHKNEHTGMAKWYPEHKNEHTGSRSRTDTTEVSTNSLRDFAMSWNYDFHTVFNTADLSNIHHVVFSIRLLTYP